MHWQINLSLIQIIGWHLFGIEPLSEPMLIYMWLNPGKHISVTLKKIHLDMLSAKWWPFCLNLKMMGNWKVHVEKSEWKWIHLSTASQLFVAYYMKNTRFLSSAELTHWSLNYLSQWYASNTMLYGVSRPQWLQHDGCVKPLSRCYETIMPDKWLVVFRQQQNWDKCRIILQQYACSSA